MRGDSRRVSDFINLNNGDIKMKTITEGEEFIYVTKAGKRFLGKIKGKFKSLTMRKCK